MPWKDNKHIELLTRKQGVCEVSVNSFDDLINSLKETENHKGWIFRGQSSYNWSLVPTLYRNFQNPHPEGIAKRHLDKFKIFARGRIQHTDNWGDQRYWSLGRHYGLKTPLLDWSASAFIGLFFAFHEEVYDDEYRSLYALNASYINSQFCKVIGDKLSDSEDLIGNFEKRYDLEKFKQDQRLIMLGKAIIDMYDSDLKALNKEQEIFENFISGAVDNFIRLISPKMGDNPRMLSQRGVFTFQSCVKPVEDILKDYTSENDEVLLKLKIPSKLRSNVMNFLNSMNINYLSLFPDLEGAAKYCNEKLYDEIDKDISNLNLYRIWI